MTEDEKDRKTVEDWLNQAKTLTLHLVLQRLIAGVQF
jgi:hypothetical protein